MMQVNIWSDVRCPFCYIGKRKFEAALASFPHKDSIKVNWQSFELDPAIVTDPELNAVEYFSEMKGISKEEAKGMFQHVRNAAATVDLKFDFENSVVANSFQAHRLIQLAKSRDMADAAEEALFKAHFTDGKNIDEQETLVEIGVSIGLNPEDVKNLFTSDAFAEEVRSDQKQAQVLGIHGVPFFVFNNKYAVSGAQSPEVFLQTLNQAWTEFEKESTPFIVTEGESCDAGRC